MCVPFRPLIGAISRCCAIYCTYTVWNVNLYLIRWRQRKEETTPAVISRPCPCVCVLYMNRARKRSRRRRSDPIWIHNPGAFRRSRINRHPYCCSLAYYSFQCSCCHHHDEIGREYHLGTERAVPPFWSLFLSVIQHWRSACSCIYLCEEIFHRPNSGKICFNRLSWKGKRKKILCSRMHCTSIVCVWDLCTAR